MNLKNAVALAEAGHLDAALDLLGSLLRDIGDDPAIVEAIIAIGGVTNNPKLVLDKLIGGFLADPEANSLSDVGIRFAVENGLLEELCCEVMAKFPVNTLAAIDALSRVGQHTKLPYELDRFRSIVEAINSGDETLDGRKSLLDGNAISNREPELDVICFLPYQTMVRVAKIASGLKLAGKKLIVITPPINDASAWTRKYFDEILEYENYTQLVEHIRSVNPEIFHLFFSPEAGFLSAFCLLSQGFRNFVIDVYDPLDPSTINIEAIQINDLLRSMFRINQKFLRYLTNHAPGNCTRTRFKRANRSLLKGQKQEVIFYPEACWNTPPTATKISAQTGMLHVVYSGAMYPEKYFNSEWSGVLWLGRKAQELDIHVHLYAVPWLTDDLGEYYELAAHSPNFHMHETLPYEDYMKELEKYDVGIHITYPKGMPREPHMPGCDFAGLWTNRIADFIDCDVYFLPDERSNGLVHAVEHYGVGERFTVEQGKSKKFWKQLGEKLLLRRDVDFARARQLFSIEKQGPRLTRFYDKVRATLVE